VTTAARPSPDFRELLPQTQSAGVVHLPKDGASAILEATKVLSYSCVEVDLTSVHDKEGLLTTFAEALAFPPWFGHNWDALEDCLTDMSWCEAEGYVLILRHADHLHARAEGDFLTTLRILADVSTTWAEAGLPFWTFVELTADDVPLLPDLA
jgi:RNAse (barnase) inhibitor barstar